MSVYDDTISELQRENAALTAYAVHSRAVLDGIKRWTLVIESAVRNADPTNYEGVMAALTALQSFAAEHGPVEAVFPNPLPEQAAFEAWWNGDDRPNLFGIAPVRIAAVGFAAGRNSLNAIGVDRPQLGMDELVAQADDIMRDVLRYRWLREHWDEVTGFTWRASGAPGLDRFIDESKGTNP